MTTPDLLHFAFPIWGATYADTFIRLTLPSLLSGGNLGRVSQLVPIRLTIVTTPQDRLRMEGAPSLQAARALMDVEWQELPAVGDGKYNRWTLALTQVMASTSELDTVYSPLPADIVFGDGSLDRQWAAIARGKRAVLVFGPRGNRTALTRALEPRVRSGVLTVSNQQLTDLLLANLHHSMRARLRNEALVGWPSFRLWGDLNDVIVLRAFHLHPVLLRLAPGAERSFLPGETVDSGFLARIYPNTEDLEVLDDSDEFVVAELSDDAAGDPLLSSPTGSTESHSSRARAMAAWVHAHAHPQLWYNSQHALIFRRSDSESSPEALIAGSAEEFSRIHSLAQNWPAELKKWQGEIDAKLARMIVSRPGAALWGAGTDLRAVLDRQGELAQVARSHGTRIIDHRQAGQTVGGLTILSPDDIPRQSTVLLTSSSAETRCFMHNEAATRGWIAWDPWLE